MLFLCCTLDIVWCGEHNFEEEKTNHFKQNTSRAQLTFSGKTMFSIVSSVTFVFSGISVAFFDSTTSCLTILQYSTNSPIEINASGPCFGKLA